MIQSLPEKETLAQFSVIKKTFEVNTMEMNELLYDMYREGRRLIQSELSQSTKLKKLKVVYDIFSIDFQFGDAWQRDVMTRQFHNLYGAVRECDRCRDCLESLPQPPALVANNSEG